MKIYVYGFEWRLGNRITLEEFQTYLHGLNGREYRQGADKEHILAVTRHQDWWTGLMLTTRSAKSFCQMRRDQQAFTVTKAQLEDHTNMVDFNFFVISPETGRGLYQHYYQSATLDRFCGFCGSRFNELREAKIQAECDALGTPTDRQKQAIQQQYLDHLGHAPILRSGDFAQRVSQLAQVKELSWEFATYKPQERDFQTIADKAKRVAHHATFTKNDAVSVRNAIANIAKKRGFYKARVVGLDSEQREQVYNLLFDSERFAEHEYDDWVTTVKIDSRDLVASIVQSHIIAELIQLAEHPNFRPYLCKPAGSA